MIWHQSCSTGRVRSSKQSRSNFKKLEFQRPIPHKLMACISILHSLQFQSVLRSIAMPHHPTHVLGRCVLWVDVHYLLLVLFQNSFSSATFPIFYVHSCHLQRQNNCIGAEMHNRRVLFSSKPFTDVRYFKHRLLVFRHSGFCMQCDFYSEG